jgi:hypothetical protein
VEIGSGEDSVYTEKWLGEGQNPYRMSGVHIGEDLEKGIENSE